MSRGLPRSLDLSGLARIPRFRHCFRYPLHAHDFHPLREGERLRGYYAANPCTASSTRADTWTAVATSTAASPASSFPRRRVR
jgi:hypothetical protein